MIPPKIYIVAINIFSIVIFWNYVSVTVFNFYEVIFNLFVTVLNFYGNLIFSDPDSFSIYVFFIRKKPEEF